MECGSRKQPHERAGTRKVESKKVNLNGHKLQVVGDETSENNGPHGH